MKTVEKMYVASAAVALACFTAVPSAFGNASSQSGTDAPKSSMQARQSGPCVCLASDLIGTKVTSPQGEKLGKIEDVVVYPGGEVAYAVLSFGGVLGLGDKLFAIPWNVLKPTGFTMPKDGKDSEHTLVLPVEKEKLKNAPGFDKSHWPDVANPDWARDIDTYYSSYRSTPKLEKSRAVESSAGKSETGFNWKYSDLKGFDVRTPSGAKLGDIKEVAIDTEGQISYVVLSVGGFLGIGDKLVAVPWGAIKVSHEGEKGDKKKLTLATTKERLEQAPVFDKEKRETCDPAWIGKLYDYYSVRPYWSQKSAEDEVNLPPKRDDQDHDR